MPDSKARRQYSTIPLHRRVLQWPSRLFGAKTRKSQKVYVVHAGGHRYKRIVLRDSYLAARIERNLERFGPSNRVPGLVMRYENELWVDFIDGLQLVSADAAVVRELAALYGEIYARAPRRVAIAGTRWVQSLRRDLRFLHRMGVLAEPAYSELAAAAETLAPDHVWVGFDYTDPMLKNFVAAADDGRICAIDIESLEADQLIGFGVAKALLRWMESDRDVFLAHLAGTRSPNFQTYFDFVELSFLAWYTKLMVVEEKWTRIDASHFDRFRRD